MLSRLTCWWCPADDNVEDKYYPLTLTISRYGLDEKLSALVVQSWSHRYLYVEQIVVDGLGYNCGLRAGDHIIEFNGLCGRNLTLPAMERMLNNCGLDRFLLKVLRLKKNANTLNCDRSLWIEPNSIECRCPVPRAATTAQTSIKIDDEGDQSSQDPCSNEFLAHVNDTNATHASTPIKARANTKTLSTFGGNHRTQHYGVYNVAAKRVVLEGTNSGL